MKNTRTIEERFWPKVQKKGEDECWEWQAGKNKNGYGRFRIGSRTDGTYRTVSAHRLAWELCNGPISKGTMVCHRCDNPPCCKPRHLFLGTAIDNSADRDRKGRHKVRFGSEHGNAKLTWDDVDEIRKLRTCGLTLAAIGARFGVSESRICTIAKNKEWRRRG